MDVQALEQSGDLRIKFVCLDGAGEPVADATEADYKAFFQTIPSGWEIKSVRDIHTKNEGECPAHVLAKDKAELAAVEHETGIEFVLPVAQAVAAGLTANAVEGLLKWAWEKWADVRKPDLSTPGAQGRQAPTFRLETATTANGTRAVQRHDFDNPQFDELRSILTPEIGESNKQPKEQASGDGNGMPLAAVQRGNLDKRKMEILDVYWAVRDYRIYRTERGISPHFSDNEATALKQRKRYMDIGPRLSKLNGLLNVRYIADSEAFFNREIARAVALALEGEKEKAEETLKHVEERASKAWQMAARTEYIVACGIVTLIVTLVWLLYPNLPQGAALPSKLTFQIAALGAWGAFLSVAMGIASLEVDPYAGTRYNHLTGILRIVVGMLGAIVLYFVLKSGVFAGLAVGAGSAGLNEYAIYVLSVVAGFSERMVPNILGKISNQADDKPDKDDKSGMAK